MSGCDKINQEDLMKDDEAISAWLDCGLEKDGEAAMEEMAAMNEGLALRAARFRHMDELVRNVIPEDDSVPQALLDRLGLSGPTQDSAEVVSLAEARASRDVQRTANAAPRRSFAPFANGWRVAAQVVLVIGIGLAGTVYLGRGNDGTPQAAYDNKAEYTALGDATGANSSANAVVMFAGDVDADEGRAIAAHAGASVISGPSSSGAWQLAIDPAKRAAVLERLRRHSDVTMAEPLDGAQP